MQAKAEIFVPLNISKSSKLKYKYLMFVMNKTSNYVGIYGEF